MSTIGCLVCGEALALRPVRGRKSGKPFLMFTCPRDGRHFRGFITFQPYVREVLDRAQGARPQEGPGGRP